MTNTVVYIRRNNLRGYDGAAISSLESRGWSVDVRASVTGSWDNISRVIIGAPDDDHAVLSNAATIAALPVPVVSLCRATSVFGLQMGGCAFFTTRQSVDYPIRFTRDVTDSRALYSQITIPTNATLHGIRTFCSNNATFQPNTTIIYKTSATQFAGGIVERIVGGHSRVHFGYHMLDIAAVAAPELLDLFAAFTGGVYSEFTPDPGPGPQPGDCHVSGIIRDQFGAPAARTVRLYNRSTGALLDETTSNGNGEYFFVTSSTAQVQVVALATSAGLNDIISRATPGGC